MAGDSKALPGVDPHGPFSAGSTRVGMPPVLRLPAQPLPRINRSPLPDIDALAHDPVQLEAELLDLAANALWHSNDRQELAESDVHLVQVLKLVERLDVERTGRAAEVETLQRQLATLQGQAEQLLWRVEQQSEQLAVLRGAECEALLQLDIARHDAAGYRKAYESEREAAARAANTAASALALNAKRCEEADRARRTVQQIMVLYSEALLEVARLEAQLIEARFDIASRSAAELSVPPADDGAFDEPRVAMGTNPENETVVIDLPADGGVP